MEISPVVLDLSHHNDVSKGGFGAMREFGVRGIIHKATQGLDYVDKTFEDRRADAISAGLLWGAYHFGDDSDSEKQARHFVESCKPENDTLVALDIEPNGEHSMTIAQGQVFLETVAQELGRAAVVYAGFYTLDGHMTESQTSYFGQHRLWLASYNSAPKTPKAWQAPWLWQFSGDGRNSHGIRVPGVSLGVDMNTFGGSLDELAQSWADPAAVKPETEADAHTAIVLLQAMLSTAGFSPGPIDGLLGPQTVRAVQRWGGLSGKNVDGIVGPQTRPILERAARLSKT